MRTLVLLALLASICVAFNVFRDNVDDQILTVRKTRDADSSQSSEEDDKNVDGSGSGAELRRVAREASGDGSSSSSEEETEEGSGIQVTSAPVRFVRSADIEGSGSGDN